MKRNIILDTDISSDSDDVGAVSVLHELAKRDEVSILGMMVSSGDPWAAGCLIALNNHFNRSDIPVGKVSANTTQSAGSTYTKKIAQLWGESENTGNSDSVVLYRRLLEQMPDHSVTIVTIGYLTNLRALLLSQPDEYSDLDGLSLVKRKVVELVCMGGEYLTGKEWNFYQDPESARFVAERWPTKIIFIGYELGVEIVTGQGLAVKPVSNPIRMSYELHNNLKGRPSWDQLAVLFAGFSGKEREEYFNISDSGTNVIDTDGSNTWGYFQEGRHYYLLSKQNNRVMSRMIEDMMTSD